MTYILKNYSIRALFREKKEQLNQREGRIYYIVLSRGTKSVNNFQVM